MKTRNYSLYTVAITIMFNFMFVSLPTTTQAETIEALSIEAVSSSMELVKDYPKSMDSKSMKTKGNDDKDRKAKRSSKHNLNKKDGYKGSRKGQKVKKQRKKKNNPRNL